MKAPEKFYDFEKDISGCGVFGVINRRKQCLSGDIPIRAMSCMHDRGNGLGGGFAAYGIYPDLAEKYCFQLLCDNQDALDKAEELIKDFFDIHESEPIRTRKVLAIPDPPIVWRFFVSPKELFPPSPFSGGDESDYIVGVVMKINKDIPGAYVLSSGKNMGAFKGVGYPEDIAEFYRLEGYSAYIWTGHNRFPTNTPGWWGGAHPFTILDWSIVHNGEISSYGINRRYLCTHGYECTMGTDTEVVAYLIDLLVRKHGLNRRLASSVFAPPFWEEIEKMDEREKKLYTALRTTYASAMLNGPFAILVADQNSLWGLNDRIKLRPLVVASKGDSVYMSSEESAIRLVCPDLDEVWMPKAGEPVIIETLEAEND